MTVIKTKRFSWQESISKLDPWKLFTEQCLDFSLEMGDTLCNVAIPSQENLPIPLCGSSK